MKIFKELTVEQLTTTFQKMYPYLMMKVYDKGHGEYEGSRSSNQVKGELTMLELNPNMKEGEIELLNAMSVLSLEQAFEEQFGIHIQIFRKSGDQWVQTTSTDNWPLEKHSRKAKEMEDFMKR